MCDVNAPLLENNSGPITIIMRHVIEISTIGALEQRTINNNNIARLRTPTLPKRQQNNAVLPTERF